MITADHSLETPGHETACQTHAVVSSAMSRPDAMSQPTLTQASLLRRLTPAALARQSHKEVVSKLTPDLTRRRLHRERSGKRRPRTMVDGVHALQTVPKGAAFAAGRWSPKSAACSPIQRYARAPVDPAPPHGEAGARRGFHVRVVRV